MPRFNTFYDTLHYPILVFMLFLTLKLTGTINWSWFAITSPLWCVWTMNIIIWIIRKTFFSRSVS